MKIRNVTCITGALFGVAYTVYGMYGAYHSGEVMQTEGMKALEGLVLCLFTVPFGAAVGLSIGLLLEGLVGSFKPKQKKESSPESPETSQEK